ncbi:oxygenase MpaB family protein [Luteimonas abyssi]|uniref:oxygenase MpaB family protein n=1 Tax=Luteimonas abyssi TaxID=1247514 RepID=UPI000B2F8574
MIRDHGALAWAMGSGSGRGATPFSAAARAAVLRVFPRGQSGIDYDRPGGDPGLFGPDSATWRIHGDFPGMLAGGLCALMMQTLHPRALAGVWDHSDFRRDMVGRLRRTTAFIAGTTYAGRAEADRLIARVAAIHAQVRGCTADGEPYAADDPDLLTWVHTTEAYAFLHGFRAYGGIEVPDAMADRYYDEVRRVAEALGARDVPGDRAAVDAYFEQVRPTLRVDARSREVLAVLRRIRLPVPGAVALRGLFIGAGAALLPPWAEAMLGFGPIRRGRHRLGAWSLGRLAPVFRAALPDGACAHACRRVGVAPARMQRWPMEPATVTAISPPISADRRCDSKGRSGR